MLNEIHIEGAVTSKWKYEQVQFVRLACRLDSGRRQSSGNGRPSEYVTLRFEPPTMSRAASTLRTGSVVRATGYLSSREYDINLKSFADSAEGDGETLAALRELAKSAGYRVRKPHVLNEVVVERFSVVEDGQSSTQPTPAQKRRRSRPRRQKKDEEVTTEPVEPTERPEPVESTEPAEPTGAAEAEGLTE